MQKFIFFLSFSLLTVIAYAQQNTEVEIVDDRIDINATKDVNINTANGKAYYNGKEISTQSDSIIETPFHPLKVMYVNLLATERIDGIEDGISYSDFLITKSRSVRDGSQWCARLEYCICMNKDNEWPSWDGKIVSNNRYSVNQIYKFGFNSIVYLDVENEKMYLRLYGAGEGYTFTSFRVEFSYFHFQ